MSFRNLLVSAALLLLASLVSLAQETPRELGDLVGIRASSGESELQNRGYSFVKTEEAGDRKYSYWWNESRRICLSVATYNGRYNAILKTPPFDCGRNSNSGNNNNRRDVTVFSDRNFRGTSQAFGPGRYLAMGNQLGALRNDDASSVMVERGFRVRLCESEGSMGTGSGRCEDYGEGRFNLRYDNKASYIEVTRVGGGGGGAERTVDVSDLVGARASSGEDQMRSRGFRYVDGFDSGNTKYSIWWRSRSRQCIQVATANGRYDSVTDIGSHARCR
jgi:hypothetical protein